MNEYMVEPIAEKEDDSPDSFGFYYFFIGCTKCN